MSETTENTQPAESASSDGEAVAAAAETQKSADKTAANSAGGRRSGGLSLFLIALLAGGSGYGGYLGWQQLSAERQSIAALQQQLVRQSDTVAALEHELERLQSEGSQTVLELAEQVEANRRRLDAQNKRLLSMSTTTKEDWQLLEARYLLRLANQRLLTERDSAGSVAQLQAADQILAQLGDVALFPVRKTIAQDIAALQLAPGIDRDGVYLRLGALSENLKNLPALEPLPGVQPVAEPALADTPALMRSEDSIDAVIEEGNESGWRGWLAQQWRSARSWLAQFYVVKPVEGPVIVLDQEARAYMIERLRLKLELAQLALLGEKQAQYQQNIRDVRDVLHDYYQINRAADRFIAELDALAEIQVERQLPDISSSMQQLDAYIEMLHKLQDSNGAVQTPDSDSGEA